jgi:hypothetical protein
VCSVRVFDRVFCFVLMLGLDPKIDRSCLSNISVRLFQTH